MDYHIDVLNWNDLAGEEAFHNAKRRFWAKIHCITCNISPPDPDMYIDDIDWNPYIDPELVQNLDKEFFAHDELKEYCKLEDSNQKTNGPLSTCTAEGYDRNTATGQNPWELNMQETLKDRAWAWDKWGGCKNELSNSDKTNSQLLSSYGTEGPYRKPYSGDCPWEYWNMQGVLKDETQKWNRWGGNVNESRNLNGDDCWKQNGASTSGAMRDYSGGHSEDNSWRMWNEGPKHINQNRNLDRGVDHWKRSCNQANETLQDNTHGGWGQGCDHQNKSRNLDTADDPWKRGCHGAESRGFEQGGKRNNTWGGNQAEKDKSDSSDKSKCWKQWENCNNGSKILESRESNGVGGVWNGGCRKREGSHQNTSSYKCSRVQGDGYQQGCWVRKEEQRRGSISQWSRKQ